MILNDLDDFAWKANNGQLPMRVFADWQENELNLSAKEVDFFGPPLHLLELDVQSRHLLLLEHQIGCETERILPDGCLTQLFHEERIENVSFLSLLFRKHEVLNELQVEQDESIIQVLLRCEFLEISVEHLD